MSWFTEWLSYGFGREAVKAVIGEDQPAAARAPIRQQTEAEIRADEQRYAEDAQRLDAEDEAVKKGSRAAEQRRHTSA